MDLKKFAFTITLINCYSFLHSQTEITQILPPIYDSITVENSSFKKLYLGDSISYYNLKNNLILDTVYPEVKGFINGFGIASDSNVCFHIDGNGKRLYKDEYDRCGNYYNNKAIVIRKNKNLLIDSTGNVHFSINKGTIKYYNDQFVYYIKKDKIHVVDYNNKSITKDQPNVKGSILYLTDDKAIYIYNHKGKRLEHPFQEITVLSPKYFMYKDSTGYGMMDNRYNILFEFDASREMDSFINTPENDSILFVIKNDKWALFDKHKGLQTDFEYDRLKYLDTNVIVASLGPDRGIINQKGDVIMDFIAYFIPQSNNDKWYRFNVDEGYSNYVNPDGKILFNPETGKSEYFRTTILNDSLILVRKDGLSGIVNFNNEVVIPIEYEQLKGFKNGFAEVVKSFEVDGEKQFKQGYINLKNEFFEVDGRFINGFRDGYAYIRKDSYYSVIDSNFNIVIPYSAKYDKVMGPSEGLFAVRKNYKYGYVDLNGNVVIDFQFNNAKSFSNGIAQVNFNSYINKLGEIIYDSIEIENQPNFNYSIAAVTYQDKWSYIEKNNTLLSPFEYDEVSILNDQNILVKKEGLYGVINRQGNVLIPIEYKEIVSLLDNLVYLNQEPKKLYTLSKNQATYLGYDFSGRLQTNHSMSLINGEKSESYTLILKVIQNNKVGLIQVFSEK